MWGMMVSLFLWKLGRQAHLPIGDHRSVRTELALMHRP